MAQAARLVRHRDGVPVYQYCADFDTPPVSVVRASDNDVLERGRRTGRTVQEWIIERRMAEARSLLSDTELSVGEISRRVGMSDPGYFSRLFRRTHGTSPRKWRGGLT
jgi:AraC-like DNA-binding protein